MTKQELFVLADQSLKNVVGQIKEEQWKMTMPDWFPSGKSNLTLREVINYHAYDDAWIPAMFAGKTTEEAGKDKFDGDLLGNHPKENFASIVEKACSAVRSLSNLDFTIHYSYGDYPAGEALEHVTIFRGLRVYTIAKVIGADTQMPDGLVQGLWDIILPQAEELRAMGVFAPKIEVPEDAPLQDRLLGLVGISE